MNYKKRVSSDEQYQLILECRSSGLSDYRWCTEHDINPGTFYNWVKRLRKKACYDIPKPAGKNNYKPQVAQEVVPLLIVDDDKVPGVSNVEHNTRIIAKQSDHVAEITYNGLTISITNDINQDVLFQLLRYVGGAAC